MSAFWGKEKVVLRQTPRAVTPFGGLSVLVELLHRIGYRQQVSEHMPVQWRSPNAIDPGETFTAFLMAVVAGARRFAHTGLLRADRGLQTLLGIDRFPTDGTLRNLFKRFTQGMVVGEGGGVIEGVGVAVEGLRIRDVPAQRVRRQPGALR